MVDVFIEITEEIRSLTETFDCEGKPAEGPTLRSLSRAAVSDQGAIAWSRVRASINQLVRGHAGDAHRVEFAGGHAIPLAPLMELRLPLLLVCRFLPELDGVDLLSVELRHA